MTARGKFNDLIKFQRRSTAADGYGNRLGTWSDLCGPFYARMRPVSGGASGKEQAITGRLVGVQSWEMVVMKVADTAAVTTQDRVVDVRSGQIFDIVSISNPDEKLRELSMFVKSYDAETQ